MPDTVSISPADLLIDEENPRLPQPNVGQREAQRGIAAHQNKKLLVLARDILEHGVNPAKLPIVMPRGDDLKRYVVLEGNRRVVALKSLENPEPLVGAIDASVLAELRNLSKQYQESPIEKVPCLLVKDREEARHWIELEHTGENEGAGVVKWGSDDSARFRARSGNLEIHSQALNFLEQRGDLTTEQRRKIPATSYKRLLETPAVREKIGLDLVDGKMVLLGEAKHVSKALLFIAKDLASGTTKVKQIYTSKQRVRYANNLPDEIVVKTTGGNGKGKNAAGFGKQKKGRAKRVKPRDYLIPRDCVLSVTDNRVSDIENELRGLKLEDWANAISVLFRVFVELSADAYIADKKHPLVMPDTASLGTKLLGVAADLVQRQKLTKAQVVPVRRACQRDSFIAPSITLMHQYIHSLYVFPAPSDLRAYWNSLQPFIAAIWSP